MTDLEADVLDFVAEHEPLDQDRIEAEFGRQGLVALRTLMWRDDVSYNIDWDVVTDDE